MAQNYSCLRLLLNLIKHHGGKPPNSARSLLPDDCCLLTAACRYCIVFEAFTLFVMCHDVASVPDMRSRDRLPMCVFLISGFFPPELYSVQGCVYQQEILTWGQLFYHIIIWQLPCWAWPPGFTLDPKILRFHASLRPACWLQLVGSRDLRSVACSGRWAGPALVDWTSDRPTAVFRGEGLVGQGDPWWIPEWDVLMWVKRWEF